MDNKEFWDSPNKNNYYNKEVHKLLSEWKKLNGITVRCCVHHRDDTEEVRNYNKEHYEFWGFNQDGTFEYGKYVIFMTIPEHTKYHCTGEKHPQFGTHPSEETRKKMSDSAKAKIFSDEHRQHLSDACKGERNGFYGKHHSAEMREHLRQIRTGLKFKPHTDETKFQMSEKRATYWANLKVQFEQYKLEHPECSMTIKKFQSFVKSIQSNG